MIAAVVLNVKANILLADNQLEMAIKTFEQSIHKNPGYITPYLNLAKILIARNQTAEAIDVYKQLIENRSDQPSPHALVGTLYEQTGNYDLAQSHYEKALTIDPDHTPAANNLAYLYAEQEKQLDKALDLARQAKKKMGQNPAVMDTLGWVYYKKGLYDSAAMEFESCIKIDPSNPVFLYHLGLAYNKLGRHNQAKNALQKALNLQQDFKGSEKAQAILNTL